MANAQDDYTEEIARLTPLALRSLRDSMLQDRDLKSKNDAAKAILAANQALRQETIKREELSSLTAEGTLPARFLALAMAGLARLGGVAIDPASLEPQVEQLMLDKFNEDLKPAPDQKTEEPIHDPDAVYTNTPIPAHGTEAPAYLATAQTPLTVQSREATSRLQDKLYSGKRSGR